MIEEQAEVVSVEGSEVLLQAQSRSACGSCSVNQACGTSLLAKVVGRKLSRFRAENRVNAQPGDRVIVGIEENALLKGSVMMYLLPVFSMLVFAIMAEIFLLETITARDLLVALAALLGLIAGALLSKAYFQRAGNRQFYSPVILRKIL